MAKSLEQETYTKFELAAMDLEEAACEVATVAVHKAIVIPDGEANRVHDIESDTTTDQHIETAVLGVLFQLTAVDVVLHTRRFLLDP